MPWITPVSCTGKKPFGIDDVEQHGQRQRRDRDEQRRGLAVEHPVEHPAVARDDAVEQLAAPAIEARSACPRGVWRSSLRAHHRRQRQRHHRRDQDRHRQRDRELAEQPADDVAHEQQRNQHRDQRERQRDDREADLLASPSARPRAACRPPRCSARCSRSSRWRRRRRSRSRWSAPSASGC